MIFEFAPFTLSTDRAELVGPGGVIAIEPKAFAVLRLLVENHDRVVAREELIEMVWGGRFISDAAVSTALKFARKALGDDGVQQRYIRTLHGQGLRFVAPVARRVPAPVAPLVVEVERADGRPTLAVLPFVQTLGGEMGQLGDGLAAEIISTLSRLRWLRVIARESTFRFRQDSVDLTGLHTILGATYALTGRVELWGRHLTITVDLIRTIDGAVVWSDRFEAGLDDIHEARHMIVTAVITALDLQIPQAEATLARMKPTEMLDAWGAYHLGMSHLYRFNAHDNAIAGGLFERATRLDPGFATAFAAWSLAKFQDATHGYRKDFAAILPEVRRLAERGVELDPYDPFANMAMGRIHMLEGEPDDGIFWYDRSVSLSPSYSRGHYSRGIIDALKGRSVEARRSLDLALGLSPLDPLLSSMLAMKALSFMVDGEFAAARDWSMRAVRSNQAHFYVVATAAALCHLAGDKAQAAHWVQLLRARRPDASVLTYLRGLPFASAEIRATLRGALNALGIPD